MCFLNLLRPRFSFEIVLFGIFASAMAGCDSGPRAAPVDAQQARAALQTVLDAWKAGDQPDALQQQSPSIVVQDLDWKDGMSLTDYEIVEPAEPVDANLYCPVRLQLRDSQGKDIEKTVTYIVGTDPVLTVFRQIF